MDQSFEALIARVRAESFIADLPDEPKRKRTKRHRVALMADKLTPGQKVALKKLLTGDAVMQVIRGEPYAVWRAAGNFSVHDLAADGETHTVYPDASACSCEDNRFRHRDCKHIEAVRKLL